MKRRVTIKDIARELKLSASTVSRALLNDKNIRRETQERVVAMAKELGYSPNPVATNLKFGRTNSVGVIVPEMITPYAATVIEGIQSVLYPKGLRVMIASSEEDPQREAENLKQMLQFMVDGVIISLCDYHTNRELFEEFERHSIPLLFYDRIPHNIDATQIVINDYTSAFFLVEELIRAGRKRITFLAGPHSIYNSKERERGYRDAMRKFGLTTTPSMIIEAGVTFKDGAAAVDKIDGDCDAIFAFTDTLAIGAMNRLIKQGKRVPEDIAIVGFSGTELSTIVTPELTTVEAPLRLMGQRAAEILLEMIADPNIGHQREMLEAEIMLRDSTPKSQS